MYSVDGQDTLEAIRDIPPCDIGAPLPAIVAMEGRLFLAYIANEPDPEWDGSYTTIITPQTEDRLIAVVEFKDPVAHIFGSIPDEETIRGHPLAGVGLGPYELFEVRRSSWVRRLEQMRSSSPGHWPDRLIGQRHFILGLHDSTFECVARSFEFRVERGSIGDVLQTMARMAVA
jgi:hypothetical protein